MRFSAPPGPAVWRGAGSRFSCPNAPLQECLCVCAREGGRLRGARLTVLIGESARGRWGRWGQARSGDSSVPRRSLPPRPGPQLTRRTALVPRRGFPHLVPALPGPGSLSLLIMANVWRGCARPGHPRTPHPLRGPHPDRGPGPHTSGPSATQSFIRKQPVTI